MLKDGSHLPQAGSQLSTAHQLVSVSTWRDPVLVSFPVALPSDVFIGSSHIPSQQWFLLT